jgi:hypothetical protein
MYVAKSCRIWLLGLSLYRQDLAACNQAPYSGAGEHSRNLYLPKH